MSPITRSRSKGVEALNREAINQSALHWLKKANAEYNHCDVYVLQLLWWGIEESGLRFPNYSGLGYDRKERLREVILRLMDSNPDSALRYLCETESEDPGLQWTHLEGADDPQDAAWQGLDSLESRLDSH